MSNVGKHWEKVKSAQERESVKRTESAKNLTQGKYNRKTDGESASAFLSRKVVKPDKVKKSPGNGLTSAIKDTNKRSRNKARNTQDPH